MHTKHIREHSCAQMHAHGWRFCKTSSTQIVQARTHASVRHIYHPITANKNRTKKFDVCVHPARITNFTGCNTICMPCNFEGCLINKLDLTLPIGHRARDGAPEKCVILRNFTINFVSNSIPGVRPTMHLCKLLLLLLPYSSIAHISFTLHY